MLQGDPGEHGKDVSIALPLTQRGLSQKQRWNVIPVLRAPLDHKELQERQEVLVPKAKRFLVSLQRKTISVIVCFC